MPPANPEGTSKPHLDYINIANPDQLIKEASKFILKTEIVADIGPGIRPMNFFTPKLHILVEPCKVYVDYFFTHNNKASSYIAINSYALEALASMSDKSVDSIFLLDVIEHMPKDCGFKLICEIERVARVQLIVFTPLGFMPQSYHQHDKDAWGLDGAKFQEHLSGWVPEEFEKDWLILACDKFITVDQHNNKLDKPQGSFFAIKTLGNYTYPEDEIHKLEENIDILQTELEKVFLRLISKEALLVKYINKINWLRSQNLKLSYFLKKYSILLTRQSKLTTKLCHKFLSGLTKT
jgi:hypothetical protein